jgi:hypothetical protein
MNKKILVTAILMIVIASLVSLDTNSTAAKPKADTFSAMAYLPTGAGMRMVGAGATANLIGRLVFSRLTIQADPLITNSA